MESGSWPLPTPPPTPTCAMVVLLLLLLRSSTRTKVATRYRSVTFSYYGIPFDQHYRHENVVRPPIRQRRKRRNDTRRTCTITIGFSFPTDPCEDILIGYPIIYERVRGRPWPFGTFVPYGASSSLSSLYLEPSFTTTTTTTTILPFIVRTTPLERHESSMMMIGRQLPAFVPYPQMASWHNNNNNKAVILLPPQCHYPLPIMTTTTSTISYTGSSADIGPILRRRPSYKCHRYKSRRYHSTTMPVSASTWCTFVTRSWHILLCPTVLGSRIRYNRGPYWRSDTCSTLCRECSIMVQRPPTTTTTTTKTIRRIHSSCSPNWYVSPVPWRIRRPLSFGISSSYPIYWVWPWRRNPHHAVTILYGSVPVSVSSIYTVWILSFVPPMSGTGTMIIIIIINNNNMVTERRRRRRPGLVRWKWPICTHPWFPCWGISHFICVYWIDWGYTCIPFFRPDIRISLCLSFGPPWYSCTLRPFMFGSSSYKCNDFRKNNGSARKIYIWSCTKRLYDVVRYEYDDWCT